MTPAQFLARVRKMEASYKVSISRSKEDIVRVAKAHFDRSFKEEGFTDRGLMKWPKRSPDYRPQDPTLYDTGKLSSGNRVKVMARGVAIINSTKYAGYHNYGKGQKQRRFIGNSIALNRIIIKVITKHISKALNG